MFTDATLEFTVYSLAKLNNESSFIYDNAKVYFNI